MGNYFQAEFKMRFFLKMWNGCFSYKVGIILLLNLQGCTISINLNFEYMFKQNEIILLSRFLMKCY